jgi:virulence factor
MKIAVIGLGDIAQKAYLPVLTQLSKLSSTCKKDIELIFCTRNADTLKKLTEQYRIKTYFQDYRDLNKSNIDGVMIHSGTSSHAKIARYFLEQGIATFVDKPLADSAKDCVMLHALAEKHNAPLYVGFNRRFIPLFNQYLVGVQKGAAENIDKANQGLTSLRWEKNRHNLPADIRTFVFDDFIHCIDSVNIFGKADIDGIDITTQFLPSKNAGVTAIEKQLSRIDIKWQQNGVILEASMNRNFGITQEIISANYENKSYHFPSFFSGTRWENKETTLLHLADWTPMLTSKGFDGMIDDWLNVVSTGVIATEVVKRNLNSHLLAEAICQEVIARSSLM